MMFVYCFLLIIILTYLGKIIFLPVILNLKNMAESLRL